MRNKPPTRLATPITLVLVLALVSGCAHQVAWQRAAAQDDLPTQLNAYFASLANRDGFTGYALPGVRKAEGSTRKSRLFWHAGSAPGTSASLGYLPDLGVTVVILSDSDHIDLFTIESDVYRLVIDDCITLEPCTHESAKASSRSTSSATSPALAGSWMRL